MADAADAAPFRAPHVPLEGLRGRENRRHEWLQIQLSASVGTCRANFDHHRKRDTRNRQNSVMLLNSWRMQRLLPSVRRNVYSSHTQKLCDLRPRPLFGGDRGLVRCRRCRKSDTEIALMSPEPDAPKAEACFDHALAVARARQAKSWELRAATSLVATSSRSGQARRGRRSGLLLVHRRLRHARPEGGQSPARCAGVMRMLAQVDNARPPVCAVHVAANGRFPPIAVIHVERCPRTDSAFVSICTIGTVGLPLAFV
jgi:hypothetical protein